MYSGKYLIPVAILLAFGTIAVSARDCPKVCTLEFNQVCATNGKEYRLFDNPCMLDVFNCEHEFLWTRTMSLAQCFDDTTAISAEIDDCVRPCTMEYNPTCAFDGVNYHLFDNVCEMHNAECGTDKHYEVANFYQCVPHPAAYKFCETACTFEYAPVCGFNGVEHKTFSNLCVMNNEHCKDNKVWKQTRMDACNPKPVPTVIDTCEKACTHIYGAVCGFNGVEHKVFSNRCIMENEHCKDQTVWTETLMNECDQVPVPAAINDCEKPCFFIYAPVCGFNGVEHKVFSNRCIMDNEHCKDQTVWTETLMNECDQVPLPAAINDCEKPCTFEYVPVCGSNGFTHEVFSNLCALENAHCKDGKKWIPTPFTECIEFASVEEKKTSNCEKPCNRMYRPVCGSDGEKTKIFNNECMLGNEHCKDGHNWNIAPMSACAARGPLSSELNNKNTECVKPCNRMLAPVCGTDGQTYKIFDNKCIMENEHCYDNHEWKMINFAICENPIPLAVTPKKDCPMICPMNYLPICAFNGKTHQIFSNDCELEQVNCVNDEHFVATLMIECETNTELMFTNEEEVIICPAIYNPQCGFDGITYRIFSNQCMMDAFNSKHDTGKFAHVDMSFC